MDLPLRPCQISAWKSKSHSPIMIILNREVLHYGSLHYFGWDLEIYQQLEVRIKPGTARKETQILSLCNVRSIFSTYVGFLSLPGPGCEPGNF